MKKFFIISAVIFAVSLSFLAVYNFAFKPPRGTVDGANVIVAEDDAGEEKKSSRLVAISEGSAVAPTFSEDGETVYYYDAPSGRIEEVFPDGTKKRTASRKELGPVVWAAWSPREDQAIVKVRNQDGSYQFFWHNAISGEPTPIRSGVDSINWSSLGDRIVYKYFDAQAKTRSVNSANPDSSNWKKLADTSFRDVMIAAIPKTSLVSYWNWPNINEETVLMTANIFGEGNEQKVFAGKFGADYRWSPEGDKALVSFYESPQDKRPKAGLLYREKGNFRDLDLPTYASKCVWSSTALVIYCALPTDSQANINEYLNGQKTKDTFWKVDVASGKKERVIELEELSQFGQDLDVTDPVLSQDSSQLIFVNRWDGKLYLLNLK